jgi:FtsH-binding integral membrane protein
VPLFGTLVVLGLLYWKRHSHPLNFGLLALFTLMEAFTLGIVTAFYDDVIVLQALLITTGVFLGLTLFTLQSKVCLLFCILFLQLNDVHSKYDFSGMGPWLFGGLLALGRSCAILHPEPPSKSLAVMTGFVGAFIPFSSTLNLIYAIGGTLLFSGYIVYDTYLINRRLSPDEYILGAISLYLDFINLFLNILRLLSNMQDR